MDISLVVASAKNGVIGNENRLLWRLPEELKHFKQVTMGKAMIMGRKTFESIGKPLPGRKSIVLSRQALVLPEGVDLAASVSEALALAQAYAQQQGQDEIMVIGGEQIYQLFMPYASKLYLTKVDAEMSGDAYFSYNENDWQLRDQQQFYQDERHAYGYSLCLLEKVSYKKVNV